MKHKKTTKTKKKPKKKKQNEKETPSPKNRGKRNGAPRKPKHAGKKRKINYPYKYYIYIFISNKRVRDGRAEIPRQRCPVVLHTTLSQARCTANSSADRIPFPFLCCVPSLVRLRLQIRRLYSVSACATPPPTTPHPRVRCLCRWVAEMQPDWLSLSGQVVRRHYCTRPSSTFTGFTSPTSFYSLPIATLLSSE